MGQILAHMVLAYRQGGPGEKRGSCPGYNGSWQNALDLTRGLEVIALPFGLLLVQSSWALDTQLGSCPPAGYALGRLMDPKENGKDPGMKVFEKKVLKGQRCLREGKV